MRGGTCLHKLFLPQPLRYSEDLDYVQFVTQPIGPVFDRLRDIGAEIGLDVVRTEVSEHMARLRFRATSIEGVPIRIKVEANTREKEPLNPHEFREIAVDSRWFSGRALVRTFAIDELLGTKVRALYQRRKGRDLFDLWLGFTRLGADPNQVARAFRHYLGAADAPADAIGKNFQAKLQQPVFRADLEALVTTVPVEFSFDTAMQFIVSELVPLL
ncbi:MAG: nucleotidyl transferase AbiEii/AbiGii toxin family protein [Chloroflexota bacterium]